MKILLLSAGVGTRLKPYTDDLPKCLLPFKGKNSLQRWLDAAIQLNPDEIIINTHYLHQHVDLFIAGYIEAHQEWKDKIIVSYESLLLGSAGTLHTHKKSDDFIVVYTDVYFQERELEVLQKVTANKYSPRMVCIQVSDIEKLKTSGTVITDAAGVITEFAEKSHNPKTNIINAGVYYFPAKCLQLLAKVDFDLSTDFIPKLVHSIEAVIVDINAVDIGSVEEYERMLK